LDLFDALRRWDNFMQASGLSPVTRANYRYWLLRFGADIMVDPCTVTEDDVAAYLASLSARGQARQQVLRALKSFYAWAARRGAVAQNPVEEFRFISARAGPAASLSAHEVCRLVHAAANRNPRRAWALILLLETGARIGSLAGVRPADTGTETGEIIRFRVAKHNRPYALPLSPLAAEAVRELLPGANGTLIGIRKESLWRWCHEAAVDAGFPPGRRHPHLARHTAATALLRRTKNVRLVQEFLNHADLTQMHRYVAVTNDEMREALSTPLSEPEA